MDAALVEGVHLVTATNGHSSGSIGDAVVQPGVPPLLVAIRGDLAHTAKLKEIRYPSIGGAIDILSIPGTWAVIIFRLASTAHSRGLRPLSRLLFFVNTILFGCELNPGAIAQPGLVVPHPVGMGCATACRMGERVVMMRHSGMGAAGNPKRPGVPSVGDDVLLMDSAKVLGPVHVGDRSMIGSNAIVVDDIPADMFVYGPRKSDTMRPLSEMGLGEQAEAELGYGRAGRRMASAGRGEQIAPEESAGATSNGDRPVEVT
jgi:serine O-acetyltransferase